MAPAVPPPRTTLTIYLLRDGITANEALPNKQAFESFQIATGHNAAELFVKRSRRSAPRWAAFFRGLIDVGQLGAVASVSAVLLMRTAGRLFAVTFGHGRLLLADECWEERFGLKIALNSVAGKIRSVDKQTVDSLGRHARIQSSRDAGVMEFGIDIEQDLLRAVTGSPVDTQLGSRLTGMDAIRTTVAVDPGTLPGLLKRFLDKSDETRYRRDFPWIDHIREINSETEIRALDEQLATHIDAGQIDNVALAVPIIVDWNDIELFRYHGIRDTLDHAELSFTDVLTLFRQHYDSFSVEDLRRCRISAIDADGTTKHNWNLRQCIHGELTIGGVAHVISAGRWFRVHKKFEKEIDDAFASTPRFPDALPPYEDKTEKLYCRRVSAANGHWILMDRKLIRYGGGRNQVEFCDLFGPTPRLLVHIKRYGGSSPLSHLFAQALVSGETFRVEPAFRLAVNEALPALHRFQRPRDIPEGYSVVLAIAKPKDFTLPFFAKVALRHAVKRLNGYGYKVFLAHIQVAESFALMKKARPRKPRANGDSR